MTRFFFLISPKVYFISTPSMHLVQILWLNQVVHLVQFWWLSQAVVPGSETGLVLELFFVSQLVGRGFEPLLRHTIFAISMSRKISRCLAGVLYYILECICNVVCNVFILSYLYPWHCVEKRSVWYVRECDKNVWKMLKGKCSGKGGVPALNELIRAAWTRV